MFSHKNVIGRMGLSSVRIGGKENGMTRISTTSRVVRSTQVAVLLLSVLMVLLGSGTSLALASPMKGGKKIWAFLAHNLVQSSPAVVNGEVYVGSYDDNVYALNATTGAEIWTFQTGGFVYSSPAVVGGVVYIGSDDSYVYALKA